MRSFSRGNDFAILADDGNARKYRLDSDNRKKLKHYVEVREA